MNVETVARNIQVVLAPVVMVTSCAILMGGLLARYAFVTDLLRAMVRERLTLPSDFGASELATRRQDDTLHSERLQAIDAELPDLLRRHKLAHDAVLAVYVAVMLFIASMFVIAVGALSYSDLI